MVLVLKDALASDGEDNWRSVLKSPSTLLWTRVDRNKTAMNELLHKPPTLRKQPESQ